LRLDHVHHAVAGLVRRAAGDDAVHGDDGDFVASVIVFEDDLVELRPICRALAVLKLGLKLLLELNRAKRPADHHEPAESQQHE